MVESDADGPRLSKGERSRQRLVEATLDLIQGEGIPALTTARIAGKAGLAQSSFYQHFKNLDDCLEEAGRYVAARIRPTVPDLRKRATTLMENIENLPQAVELVVNETTMRYLKEPELTKLYHRYQYDPSPFGAAMTKLVEREREEVSAMFWDVSKRNGARPEVYPLVVLVSEMCTAMSQGAVSSLLYGKFDNRDMVIGMLRLMLTSALEGQMRALEDVVGQSSD